jgi:hypothetical protein
MTKIPATSTLRTLLDTIDQLDATLDRLNLTGDSLLAQQQDDLPYGAIYNALKVCVGTLLASVPVEPVSMPHVHGGNLAEQLNSRFRSLLEDRSAIGALQVLVEELDDEYTIATGRYSIAKQENDHEDTVTDLGAEAACWGRVYRSVRDLFTASNDING